MPKGQGVFDTMRAGVRSEEEVALSFMFPARNQFQKLQMMSRHQHRSMVPLAILGIFRRMFKSKVLTMLQEELNIDKISLEGLGRLEGSEIVAAKRAAREAKEED